jgi:hypothetical protein
MKKIIKLTLLFSLDHIGEIDEVRCGFRAQTFGDLVKKGRLKPTDVNISKEFYLFKQINQFRKIVH